MRKPCRAPTSTFAHAAPPSLRSLSRETGRSLLKYHIFREAFPNHPPLSVPLTCFISLPST